MSHTTTDSEELLDQEWLSATPHRSRARLVLLGALVLAAAFLGGVQVQRHWGTASGSNAATAGGLPAGLPAGFPAGGAAPGGAVPGGAVPGGTTGGADSTAETQVIGTLVSVRGHTWTVKDLGGTKHTITVDGDTQVVREQKVAADRVSTGSTVDVSGAAGGSGDLTATTITIR